jgi:hypothetical protein
MSTLMDKNSRGTITEDEYQEPSALVEDGQRLTLRKANAMKVRTDRGYQHQLDDMKAVDE